MSAIGGRDYRISADLVLDLDKFQQGLSDAERQAKVRGEGIGRRVARGIGTAVRAVAQFGLTVEGLKKIYEVLDRSVQRIAERRGEQDPAVQTFRELAASLSDFVDTLVDSALSSKPVQVLFDALGATLRTLGQALRDVSAWLNRVATSDSEAVLVAARVVSGAIATLQTAIATVDDAISVIVGAAEGALALAQTAISGILNADAKLARLLGATDLADVLQATADRVARQAVATWQDARRDTAAGVAGVVAELTQLPERYRNTVDRIAEILHRAQQTARGVQQGEEQATVTLENVRDRVAQVAAGIGDSFSSALGSISETFAGLVEELRAAGSQVTAELGEAFGSTLTAATSLAVQSERAFGRSSRAAAVFARAQMGVTALQATLSSLVEVGEAQAAAARGSVAEAALHATAAATFAAAAGLAGYTAVSSGAATSSSVDRLGEASIVNVPTETQPRQTNIVIAIEGNVIGRRDYVVNELIPTLRELVEDADVVLPTGGGAASGR